MKISYNWLKQYVSIDHSPEEIARILTDTGLEVEKFEKVEAVQGGLAGVVIGKVVSCEQHPDADRLKLTKVDIQSGEELSIVCGAPNVAAGQKVVVATVGCTLYPEPDKPFKIKKSKIRGEESHGMLCAEDELGLGTGHDGILVLPEDTPVGQSAAEFFGLEDDYVFEIGLTPNRADAMGHVGVARDLVAYLKYHEGKGSLNLPSIEDFKAGNSPAVEIKIEDADACPKYTGVSISNVQVGPSPAWLQKRLRSIGLAPINNVVDVTNFVMMELGTPLHAFDGAKVNGQIVVRHPKAGEKFQTLDEVERELYEEDVLITNGTDNLCLAGVFGGISSGITESSTEVFLESAYFEPVSTRQMARRHGLNTDASFRFERGVDPALTEFALKRAALLIAEVANGTISSPVNVVEAKPVQTNHTVTANLQRCRMLMGATLSNEDMVRILEALDIQVLQTTGDEVKLSVPAYRVDVTREADIVEEILRIYGFNKIELPSKLNTSIPNFGKDNQESWKVKLSEMLVGMGFQEMMNNSLTSSTNVEKYGNEALSADKNVPILNPLSIELDTMRQSMLFAGLETLAYNQNRQNASVQLFEFGKTFHKYESYEESQRLFLMISGANGPEHWSVQPKKQTFYSIKAYAEALIEKLGLKGHLTYKPLKKSVLEEGMQLYILKNKVGEIGWPSKKTCKGFGVKNNVFVADLDWDALMDAQKLNKIQFKPLPQSFATRRDFSLLLDESVNFAEVAQVASQSDRKILKAVDLFDVYEGDKIAQGKKSYAVAFTFQDDQKTLQDKQVDAVMEKIRVNLEKQLGATLRA